MNLIYKLFKLDRNTREGVVSATSVLNVVVNVFIALIKIIIGALASSIAIVSEGVNNASDALTSILTLVGTKLAGKRPDSKHPFGYGRIEYFTSLIIGTLILVGGIEMLISSIKLIFNPEQLKVSYLSLFIIFGSALIKFVLGNYTISKARSVDSQSLEAVGVECRNDSFISIVTIAVALIFLLTGKSIDAYAGVFTSSLIIKTGLEILFDNISSLLGQSADKELANKLYREIRDTDGVINAVDMILHNYGPDSYTGSCNIEIDHKKTVGEIYDFIHDLQLRIMHEYGVVMVFGIYAVDNDSKLSKKLRKEIAQFVKDREHVKSFHAVYLDKKTDKLYCDLLVDYELEDWDKLRKEFDDYMHDLYPDKTIELTIDTDFV